MKEKRRMGVRIISAVLTAVMVMGILPMESVASGIKESDWYLKKQLEETMPEAKEDKISPVVGEIEEKRTENEKHFRLEDGTSAVAIYDNPVHFEKNGEWTQIDNRLTLETNSDNSDVYENQDSPLSVKFAKHSNSRELVSLESDKGKLSWGLANYNRNVSQASEFKVVPPPAENRSGEEQQSEEMAVKNVVSEGVYENILPDVDMQYIIKSNIVKENIILKSKDVSNSYSFEINHQGLVPFLEDDGSISFFNSANDDEAAFVFAAPFAVDANNVFTEDVSFSLQTGEVKSLMTVTVSDEWLSANDRAYPVVIDPYTKPEQKAEKIQDTFVSQNHPNTNVGGNGSFVVGKNRYDGVSRSLVRFTELPQIEDGAVIYEAYLDVVQYEFSADNEQYFNMAAYEPTSSWDDRVTWNTQPGVNENALDYVTLGVANDGAYRRLNITKLVRQWYNTGVNNGVMLKSMAEDRYAVARIFASNYPFNTPGHYEGNSDLYPGGVFCYKNATGVEDYWNYHQQSAGTAGTGYTNDFNGNLAFVHDDASTSDPLMSAAVNHVYNSSERNMDSRFGYGWRLNVLQQCMDVGGEVGKDFPYVYIDEDGTKHYFYNDNGTYKDEDGLGMVYNNIDEGELRRKITLKDKTVLKFDIWSNIRRVIDSNGNTISYNHGPNQWGNFIGNMTDSSGNMIIFHYTGDQQMSKLTAISDEAGRMIHYSYDGAGNLSRITYPDGTSSSYYYDGHLLTAAESSDGYRIEYQYSNDFRVPRVTKITEKAGSGEVGQELSMQYKNGCTTVFEDGGVDGILSTTGDNDSTTYNFDTFGRMNDVYDKESNAVGVEYYSETSGSKKNKLQAESKLNKTADNMLRNGQVAAHRNDSWYAKAYDEGLPFGVMTYNDGIDDNSCFRVQKATTYSTAGVAQKTWSLPGGTYTFSAYAKTDGKIYGEPDSLGAEVHVDIYDSSFNVFTGRVFGTGTFETDRTQMDGWERLSVTFEVPNNSNVIVFAGLEDAYGTVYFDNFQLEQGSTPSQINLINNGGFEHHNNYSPYAWDESQNQGTVREVRGGGKFVADALYMSSAPGTQNRILQGISIKPGKEGDVFTLSGWAKGSAPPKGVFRLAAAVIYENHGPIWHNIDFDTNITDWQYSSVVFSTDDNDSSTNLTYVGIHVYLFYEDNTNPMLFDGLQLLKDSGESYVYNDKGDLVSAKDAADSSKFNYDESSNLKNMTDITGTSFNYSYDSKNNLTSANDSDGLSYKFTYDSKGNPLTSQINGSSERNRIVSGKTYRIRQKTSGKYLNLSGGHDVDANDIIQYEYDGTDSNNWRLESVGGGYYKIVSAKSPSNRVLDVVNFGTSNNTPVKLFRDNGSDAQRFKLKLMPDGGYQILSKCSGDKTALNNAGGSLDNGGTVNIYEATDSPNQVWYFEPENFKTNIPLADNNIYSFRNRLTGQYADIYNNETTPGTRLLQYWSNGGSNQKFRLTDAGDNYFFIEPLHAPGMVLSVNEQMSSGHPVLNIQPKNETDDRQKFSFKLVSPEKGFCFTNKASGKVSEVLCHDYSPGTDIVSAGNVTSKSGAWVIEVANGTNIQSSSTYVNGTNKVATQTDARGNTITYGYTAGNRLLGNVTAGGNTTSYTYDGATDLLTSVSGGDGEQRVTNSYTYDKGKLKTINHNGFNYSFNYDGFGNVVSTSAGDWTLSSNSYNNQMGVLTKTTYGNRQYINYEYDRHGNISKTTNNKSESFSYTYDSKQNPLTVTDNRTGKTTKFMYDFIGRPLRIDNGNQKMNVTYDDKNRVNSFSSTLNDITNKTNYMYGDALRGEAPSRIYGVMFNGNRVLDYTYDTLARVQKKTLNTTTPFVTEYTYEQGKKADGTTTLANSIKNKDNLLSYTYDAMGNILTISNNGTLQNSYTYDSLNQLTSDIDHTTNTHNEYVYDKGGNMTSRTSYVLDENGEKQNETNNEYGYGMRNWNDVLTMYNGKYMLSDQVGNPLQYRDEMHLSWQNGKQLSSVHTGMYPQRKDIADYNYDDTGHRISKNTDNGTTNYYYDGDNLIEQEGQGSSIHFFYDDNDSVVGFKTNDTIYYYVKNIQNDIIGILDKDGNQVVKYSYDSWGKPLSTTGEQADTIGTLNPFRYRGYYYDNETGFYYLNSRYYDPVVGRFVNADIIDTTMADLESNTDKNLFSYCDNNPVSRADGKGDFWHIAIGAFVGGVISVTATIIETKAEGKEFKLGPVIVSAVAGAVSGGLAASGVGLLGQVAVNSAVSACESIGTQLIENQKVNLKKVVVDTTVGTALAAVGGKGAGKSLSKLSKAPVKKTASALTRKGIKASTTTLKKSVKYMNSQIPLKTFVKVGAKSAPSTSFFTYVSSKIKSKVNSILTKWGWR